MASNTHEPDQIGVSKETIPVSSPKNTHGLSKSDLTEASSSNNKSALSKDEEQMKSDVQPMVNETIVVENNNELVHIEVNICDTCGDLGYEKLLAICNNCEVGAEHTYCMKTKIDKVPDKWLCYDCTEDEDGKSISFIDFTKKAEKTSSQVLDLNKDPNLDLNMNPNIDLNTDPGIDLNADPDIDLNADLGIDINNCPNLDMSLGHASYFQSRSSSNFQTHTPMREFLRQRSLDDEEEQCAKRPRVDTRLSL